jgi:hypothetical protein
LQWSPAFQHVVVWRGRIVTLNKPFLFWQN